MLSANKSFSLVIFLVFTTINSHLDLSSPNSSSLVFTFQGHFLDRVSQWQSNVADATESGEISTDYLRK